MRIIKFRCWDKARENMIFNVNIPHDFKSESEANVFLDKNGKEIYEGDIIVSCSYRWNESTNKHDIPSTEYYEGVVEFGIMEYSSHQMGADDQFKIHGWVTNNNGRNAPLYERCKIIGNIYEHPNLLPNPR